MKRAATVILLSLFPQIAAAQDVPFSGPYIGGQIGAVRHSIAQDLGATAFRKKATDFGYGGFVGYDLPMGDVRIGVQGEIGNGADSLIASDGAGTEYIADPKWGYALSGRLGWVAGGQTLLFIRAGYAAERVRTLFGGPAVTSIPQTKWANGLQIGAGAEYLLVKQISVRAEIRHNDLSRRMSSTQALTGIAFHF